MADASQAYVRIREAGRGAFGPRWLVKRSHDQKDCVMQVLPSASPESAAAALGEAELLCRLSCKYTVQYSEAFTTDSSICIISQGGILSSLEDVLFDIGKLDAADVIAIAAQLSLALAQLHKQGVSHRSLSPASILLDGRGRVRLAEAGFFALLCEGGHAGAFADTAYLAPELVSCVA
jgi:serine/threonine protein kinase